MTVLWPIVIAWLLAWSDAAAEKLAYPPAPRDSVVDDYHGTPVADPYRWLEDLDSPRTLEWVEAQSRFSRDYLAARALETTLPSSISSESCPGEPSRRKRVAGLTASSVPSVYRTSARPSAPAARRCSGATCRCGRWCRRRMSAPRSCLRPSPSSSRTLLRQKLSVMYRAASRCRIRCLQTRKARLG